MSDEQTGREEAREAIRESLLQWRADGYDFPVVPVYGDLDGDGIPDYYGLDDDGELIAVSGADMEGRTNVELIDQGEGP